MEKMTTTTATGASLVAGAGSDEKMTAQGYFTTECIGPDGKRKWIEESYPNLVTYQGKNGMLDTYFAGSAYTAAWYMSLITAGSATTASTYASPTVTEITAGIITSNTRLTIGWSASASGSKSATTTSFSITGSATITGNMVVAGGSGVTTVGNTAATGGILFSAANFTGGSKTVSNGDTLNVTYSISV
jgi:hypothetical protein